MERDEAIRRIKKEMDGRDLFQRILSQKGHEIVEFYLGLLYGLGYDEGKRQCSHGRRVAKYDMNGNFIKIYGSVTLAAKSVKRDKGAVQKAASGKTSHCAGYKWKYVNESTSRGNMDGKG